MRARSWIPSLLFAVALAAGAACGGDSDASPESSPTSTPLATSSSTPSTSAEPTRTPTPTATAPPLEPTASTGALPHELLPVIHFRRADGMLAPLAVEVPPREEYSIGLSGRYELGERGMLFHYPDAKSARGFWMKNTHIDLDIAFVGADFEIQEILTMEAESLEIRRPADPYQYAIEAPAGWYAENGIEVGSLAQFAFDLDDFS